ncbi:MAG: alpha/beta hydrolase [Microthrixaceae bacterium]
MVMADRPEVETASAVETVGLLAGLGARVGWAAATAPVTYPWLRTGTPMRSLLGGFERRSLKELLTYSESLDPPQLRSVEKVIDTAAGVVLPVPWRRGEVTIESAELGGVPGEWVRPTDRSAVGTMLYLHGGGYVAAGPHMFRGFVTRLVHLTGVEAFVADYRLAPEYPYPAALDDALAVYDELLKTTDREALLIAGDSAGGGLTAAVLAELGTDHRPHPAGALLFSPEVDLTLSKRSIEANAATDILPDHPDVESYLHGVDPTSAFVSPLYSDMSDYPPLLVVAGSSEMFRDQIEAFTEAATAAGVPVEFLEESGMEHVFEVVSPWSHATVDVMAHADEFCASALGRTSDPDR